MPARRRSLTAIAVAATALLPAAGLAQTGTTPDAPTVQFPAGTIPQGVTIGGVDVSNLAALDARQRVFDQFVAPRRDPLSVTFEGRPFTIDPYAVRYRAEVDQAIVQAFQQVPAPGAVVDVPVTQSIRQAELREVLTWRNTQYEVGGRDAKVVLRGLQPIIQRASLGAEINVPRATAALAPAFLVPRATTPVALPVKLVRPSVTSVGPVIVIHKGGFRLRLYRGTTKPGGTVMKRIRTYPVAIGMPQYPTPTGNYSVIQKRVNPTWLPPDSPWAAGLGPVPPGPGNPLGTRWIGTSAPGIGMHGTPDPSSIGTMASHGCLRMYIPDAEDLYRRVRIGTRVFIRS